MIPPYYASQRGKSKPASFEDKLLIESIKTGRAPTNRELPSLQGWRLA